MEGEPAEDARDRATAELEAAVSDLFRAGKGWTREFARRFEPPLPAISFAVLRYVRTHGPVRAGDIAAAFGADKATVSRQLAVLREHGLVEQSPDPDDRRATRVAATPAASAAFDALRSEMRAQYDASLAGWDLADLEQFGRLMRRFLDSFD